MPKAKLNDSVAEHKSRSRLTVGVAVITLSTSRALESDVSGDIIQELLEKSGHSVPVRKVIPDDLAILQRTLRGIVRNRDVHAVITTGGTGLAPTDVTIEAVRPMLEKELPGFAALFMLLSYPQVKSAAMMSRALAGTIKGRAIFCLPGSPRACKLAVESLIIPELGHIRMLLES
jgi:molybdenum cofactor biosynthesis protein B